MTDPLLRELALLLPPLRGPTESRDAALRERDAALAESQRLSAAPPASQPDTSADGGGNALIEQTLTMVRAEYTVLPRFGFHQPLDYLMDSEPPSFGPVIHRTGEALPLPALPERFGYPADDAHYLHMGRQDADIVRGAISRHFGDTHGFALLDFGCSTGPVLRHFEPTATSPSARSSGRRMSRGATGPLSRRPGSAAAAA